MSKIGKKPITFPKEVEIRVEESKVIIKGPLGELEFSYPQDKFRLEIKDGEAKIVPTIELDKKTKALWGTLRAILNNAVQGVTQGFSKTLILEGLGYSAELKGEKIVFKLGFSHLVELEIPQGIKIEIKQEKGRFLITVWGIDKVKVGNFASKIKSLKPADRYHLKGFRFVDEYIPIKQVKKV